MMKRSLTVLAIVTIASFNRAEAYERRVHDVGTLKVNSIVVAPASDVVGNVLFFHGYGDRATNHMPLYTELATRGLRVISFDYPSHGLTIGEASDDLDKHSLQSLAELAGMILNRSTNGSKLPLILAGWSTGGLLAVRISQIPRLRSQFPNLTGMILYAPAVSPKTCPGNEMCRITNETLSHDGSVHEREIRPISPLYRPAFGARLLLNGWKAWLHGVPASLPTLVFVAGIAEDRYVDSKRTVTWVKQQRSLFSSPIMGYHCPRARHELDNEPVRFGGPWVRETSARFAEALALGFSNKQEVSSGSAPCSKF